jgi:hypothetical protein
VTGVDDGRALVADERRGDPDRLGVGRDGAVHAARRDDDVDPRFAGGPQRRLVRGRMTPSCQVSVRSRSHAIAATSRGIPSGSLSGFRRRTQRRRRFPSC